MVSRGDKGVAAPRPPGTGELRVPPPSPPEEHRCRDEGQRLQSRKTATHMHVCGVGKAEEETERWQRLVCLALGRCEYHLPQHL